MMNKKHIGNGFRGFGVRPNKKETFFPETQEDVVILLMEEVLHQLRLVVYPIIYTILYIPGGAGFLPSTVSINLTRNFIRKLAPEHREGLRETPTSTFSLVLQGVFLVPQPEIYSSTWGKLTGSFGTG